MSSTSNRDGRRPARLAALGLVVAIGLQMALAAATPFCDASLDAPRNLLRALTAGLVLLLACASLVDARLHNLRPLTLVAALSCLAQAILILWVKAEDGSPGEALRIFNTGLLLSAGISINGRLEAPRPSATPGR
jgi:Ni/Fe-hydrogenase subunit HybB-like protein